jgi:murein DD-endopeptidase MepM/ murein hydrolase activator NlpD
MATGRTFKLDSPHMSGDDIKEWQQTLKERFDHWRVAYPLVHDGDYGAISRDATASVLYGLGIAREAMEDGVTPELRVKVRNSRLNDEEKARYEDRAEWRRRLAKTHERGGKVASPLATILSSSWGYHPPVHDGVDLICRPNAALLAICDGKIIRADSSGWWGKGAPSAAVAAKGDGIIVLRSTVDVGPFKVGLNFGYGHAEHPTVKEGEMVQAGDQIGRAGFANAWHIHLVVNKRGDDRGVGDRDPMVFVRYALAND